MHHIGLNLSLLIPGMELFHENKGKTAAEVLKQQYTLVI